MADMNPKTMSPAVQIAVPVILMLVILGVFYFMYWDPTTSELKRKTVALEGLKKEIAALEVTASRLSEFQRNVAELEQRLEMLKRILPPQKETPDLVRKLQNLASQSNLKIRQLNPRSTIKKDFYEEYPISLQVDGTYHSLAVFFDRLSRLTRLVNAGQIQISANRKPSPAATITATCVATTFVYDENAASRAQAPAKRRRGRR
jgi:type IV pilus assembly protein PilO